MVNKIQTIGLAAKGVVYCIIGALTALTAFDMGGQKAGKSDVIDFLQQQPFGKFILTVLCLGIVAYGLWRLYSAFYDPKDKGSDASGIARRFGYFCSALVYLTFAVTTLMSVFSSGGSSGGGKQYYLAQLMDKDYGPFLIGLTGLIIIGVGLYQIYKGYSDKYLEKLNVNQSEFTDVLKTSGKIGYMARGVIFAVIGYFVMSAAITQNASMVKGTQGAFSFLQKQSYGGYLMGFVAIGLLGYGIFMFFVARYSKVRT